MPLNPDRGPAFFQALGREHLPETIGLRITEVSDGLLRAEFDIRKALLAPNGYLHAASVVGLADTAAGYACFAHLPDGASSFTTIELKCNFIGTATSGTVECTATAAHLGRTTQVWDAVVRSAGAAPPLALFRCTQSILWPRPEAATPS